MEYREGGITTGRVRCMLTSGLALVTEIFCYFNEVYRYNDISFCLG